MNINTLPLVQHGAPIFSLALSRDEKMLACGGAVTPVSVWDLSDGTLVTYLEGIHSPQALAFSSDGVRLAAVNVWGGMCVWEVANGRLFEQKPDTKTRRIRSLVYPANAKSSQPIMLNHSVYSYPDRSLAPDGKSLAVAEGHVIRVMKYKTSMELSQINLSKYSVFKGGVGKMVWSGDSSRLALGGRGWAGVWMPFEHPHKLFGDSLPEFIELDEKVILGSNILYAKGRTVARLEMPDMPLQTAWETFLNGVPEPAPGFKAKNDWHWNETQWGYDGVHTFEKQLVWYNHAHNPHAGGNAAEQSWANFLENGPFLRDVPEPILTKVCQAVRQLTSQA